MDVECKGRETFPGLFVSNFVEDIAGGVDLVFLCELVEVEASDEGVGIDHQNRLFLRRLRRCGRLYDGHWV